jgi:hypothetical protein
MNTPLSFTVTTIVTNCKTCTFGHKTFAVCFKATGGESSKAYEQNKDHLTNTCPMIKTKESETK